MDVWESIVLGIVEGLTEYLPVSSTGHLIIAQYLMGLEESEALSAYEICIQGGAILAVLGLYFPRVVQMWCGVRSVAMPALGRFFPRMAQKCPPPSEQSRAGWRLLINLIIAFMPAAIVGLTCSSYIKAFLFNAPTVAIAWAVGGMAILIYVRQREKSGLGANGKPLEALSVRDALCIGAMQCIAMCPGVSRSLMTMLGGLTVGLSVAAAVEFSFLLGLITLGAATCFDAVKHGAEMLHTIGWVPMLVGTLTAWISALIAVKWMVAYLNRHSLAIFGWYRIAASVVILLLILNGMSLR